MEKTGGIAIIDVLDKNGYYCESNYGEMSVSIYSKKTRKLKVKITPSDLKGLETPLDLLLMIKKKVGLKA